MLDKRLTLYSSFKQFKGIVLLLMILLIQGQPYHLTADYIEQGAYQVGPFVTHGILKNL